MLVGTFSSQTFHTYTFQTNFVTPLRTDTRVIMKSKCFKTKHIHKKFLKDEQVPKSPWKTIDRKIANTFPFYNVPPVLRNISKKDFAVLF